MWGRMGVRIDLMQVCINLMRIYMRPREGGKGVRIRP